MRDGWQRAGRGVALSYKNYFLTTNKQAHFEDVRFNAEFFEIPAHDIKNVLRADKRDDGGRARR